MARSVRRFTIAPGSAWSAVALSVLGCLSTATLLVAMIILNVISTIVTTRNPTGDCGKALHALRG